MDPGDRGRDLHDRATRGMPLSADERGELDAWYGEQDRLEDAVLDRPGTSKRLGALHSQLDAALTQLAAAGERVQELAAQNDALRQETDALKRRLGASPSRRTG